MKISSDWAELSRFAKRGVHARAEPKMKSRRVAVLSSRGPDNFFCLSLIAGRTDEESQVRKPSKSRDGAEQFHHVAARGATQKRQVVCHNRHCERDDS
jgi:hypothetical protein